MMLIRGNPGIFSTHGCSEGYSRAIRLMKAPVLPGMSNAGEALSQ
jgi:hypothetical protein